MPEFNMEKCRKNTQNAHLPKKASLKEIAKQINQGEEIEEEENFATKTAPCHLLSAIVTFYAFVWR